MNRKLPLFLSIPHAGLDVPAEVVDRCVLSNDQLRLDGDDGVSVIYSFVDQVAAHITTNIPRAIIDVNRAENDRRADGVIKQTTIWKEPVYSEPLNDELVNELIVRYYRPYHAKIESADMSNILLAVDCHTMAAFGPPVGPDPNVRRPMICLGDNHGKTLPKKWMDDLCSCFEKQFPGDVAINQPFSGGYITQTYGQSFPWLQLEVSRTDELDNLDKRDRVLNALQDFCSTKD